MTIRLGLIGCGEHSESGHAVPLARYMAANPGQIELSAACDIQRGRALRFCKKYGFARAYTDIDEMLAREKLDGCIAVVPMEGIAEVGVKLLLLRMPCVVEKPLGSSIREVTALVNAARNAHPEYGFGEPAFHAISQQCSDVDSCCRAAALCTRQTLAACADRA